MKERLQFTTQLCSRAFYEGRLILPDSIPTQLCSKVFYERRFHLARQHPFQSSIFGSPGGSGFGYHQLLGSNTEGWEVGRSSVCLQCTVASVMEDTGHQNSFAISEILGIILWIEPMA